MDIPWLVRAGQIMHPHGVSGDGHVSHTRRVLVGYTEAFGPMHPRMGGLDLRHGSGKQQEDQIDSQSSRRRLEFDLRILERFHLYQMLIVAFS